MATDRTGRRYGDDLALSVTEGPRFFARPIAFDCECPNCGRLFVVGHGRRDNDDFNRITSELHCRMNARKGVPGCGRKFLIGLVAWSMRQSQKKGRPLDQRPTPDQLAELRQASRGKWPKVKKQRGDALNLIESTDLEATDAPEG